VFLASVMFGQQNRARRVGLEDGPAARKCTRRDVELLRHLALPTAGAVE
jgi:hypothetical protein